MWQLLTMPKKIIILVFIILILIAGGGFFWWDGNQKDVRGLNKNLPEGVRVVKSLFGKEYKVVNKIDGYEFKVPKEWKGLNEIEYIPERSERGYSGDSINIEGKEGFGRVAGVDRFRVEGNVSLEVWAKKSFEDFGLSGEFSQGRVGQIEIVKTQEKLHFGGEYVYFFKKSLAIYNITGPSEELLREIILNGKW